MKLTLSLLIIALLSIISTSQVLNLTDQNFNQTLSSAKYVMVKFYAPWCGHCKTMAPEYVKLAELVKDNDVVIGQLDATVFPKTAQRFGVQGYPTVKFFIDGVAIDYRGQRTANQMYGWIKQVSETVLQELSQEKVDQLKQKQNIAVYFGQNAQKRKTIELLNLVDNSLDYAVSSSDNEKLVLYVFGKQSIGYPQNLQFTIEQIKKWAILNTLPTVVPLSSKQYLDWVFYDEATMKDALMLLRESDVTEQGYKNFAQFCQNNKQVLKCCLVDKDMDVYNGVKGYLKSQGKSVLGLTRNGLKQAYPYPHSINQLTQQSWNQFVTDVEQGIIKSLAGPAAQTDKIEYNHVKVLTDSNFTTFIKSNNVVFAEFYTTTCAHCIQFSKQYDQLAKKVYADQSLDYQVVALDIKKNKQVAAELKIVSFPSFKVYVSGQPVTYQGPITQQSILNFVKTAVQSKPIPAGSIAQVPSPSVIIYDPAETTSLKLLPALFTRYPIYHIRQGKTLKVVLKQETQTTYPAPGEFILEEISSWLFKKTDPVLVNLLNPNIDNKLREALESKTHILGLLDAESSLSASLQSTLEEYCKQSTLVCGYAKKDEPNFSEFIQWLGVESDTTSSFIYINTENYDKYLFPKKIQELNIENITQFISDVKEGRVSKVSDSKKKQNNQQQSKQEQKKTEQVKESQQESKDSDQSEETSDKSAEQQL